MCRSPCCSCAGNFEQLSPPLTVVSHSNRRKTYPIAQRYPQLVLLCAAVQYLTVLGNALPCWIDDALTTPMVPLIVFSLAARGNALATSWQIQLDLQQQSQNPTAFTPSWLTRHAHWARRSFITKVALCIAIPLFILPLALIPEVGTDHLTDQDCDTSLLWVNAVFIANVLFAVPWLILICLLAWRLSHYVDDAFAIKKEMSRIGSVYVVALICFIAIQARRFAS